MLSQDAAFMNSTLDCFQQFLFAEGSRKELDSPGLHGPNRQGDVAVPSNENHRQGSVGISKFLLQIQAAQSGKPDIEHQAPRCIRTLATQELLRGSISACL